MVFHKAFAAFLKRQARFHPKFREFLIAIAQDRRYDSYRRMLRPTNVKIQPLSEEKAVAAAANTLSVVLGLGYWSVLKSERLAARKQNIRDQEEAARLMEWLPIWKDILESGDRRLEEAWKEEMGTEYCSGVDEA